MSLLFEKGSHWLRHALVTIGALVVVVAAVVFVIIYSGVFNVAATVEDSPLLRWALITVREASVERHADVSAPETAGDVERGFALYRVNCVMCHTPVGQTPHAMSVGFNPPAPSFGPDADDMEASELFWVTKNGIRFTGMPAWAPSLTDAEIWDITAFLETLPEMTAAEYDALDARVPELPTMP